MGHNFLNRHCNVINPDDEADCRLCLAMSSSRSEDQCLLPFDPSLPPTLTTKNLDAMPTNDARVSNRVIIDCRRCRVHPRDGSPAVLCHPRDRWLEGEDEGG